MTDRRHPADEPPPDGPTRLSGSVRRFRRFRRIGAALLCATVLAACSSTATTPGAGGGVDKDAAAAAEVDTDESSASGATTSSALFDSTTVADIDIAFEQADYDAMIEAYSASGDKEWLSADVTINGQAFTQVGMRLKGNSSLMSLRNGGNGRGGGPAGTVSADDPSGLPWLIRLDKFVDGQSYEGETELVVRANSSDTALNEAVALELLGAAGLATQQSTSARLSINGGDAALRLIVENPGDEWDGAFDAEGILYKAESGGDYSYRGDDPEAYTDVFDQETDTDDEDLQPLIELLDFINNASDEEFAAGIDARLDVDAFARYLAIEDLMDNFDDIDGPGNNSYIRIDTETGQATIVAWDHNLAFGSGGTGGGAGGGAGPQGQGGPAQGGGGRGGSNILVERFEAVPELAARYDAALAELRAELYDSGLAAEILDARAEVLREDATDLVDVATIDAEVAQLESRFA